MRNVSAFFFWVFATTFVHSAELKSLEEVVGDESSPAIVSYILKRCSAAYNAMASLMLIDGGDAELSQQATDMGTTFFMASSEHAKENNLAFDATGVSKVIFQITRMYADEMMDNYAATGNRIGGVFKADIAICKSIYEGGR